MKNLTEKGAPHAPQNQMGLIVIKGQANLGKTTTCWMLSLKLLQQGAIIKELRYDFYAGSAIYPIPQAPQNYDFYAEIQWNNKFIVINSHGDTPQPVDDMFQHVLPMKPDFIICASRSRGYVWNLFESKYTNIYYKRICVWPEYAVHPADTQLVKEPMVAMIINRMK